MAKPLMHPRSAELLLLTVTLIAAAGWLFSKYALAELPPYSFLAMRFTLASLALMLFCWPEIRRLSGNQIFRCMIIGSVLGTSLLCWILGLRNTEFIGEGAFIVSLSVVIVPIIGRLFFGDTIKPRLLVALLPALSGMAMMTLNNGFHLESSQIYFLCSTLGFSLHLNLSSHYVRQIPPLALSALQLGATGIIATVAALLTESWAPSISISTWIWLLCSALLATSIRFALQTRALQVLNPSHASMLFLAEPVWTALLGAWMLTERMSSHQLIGCALIFTSLIIYRGDTLFNKLTRRS